MGKVEKNLAEIGIRDGETLAQDRVISIYGNRFVVCVTVMCLNNL